MLYLLAVAVGVFLLPTWSWVAGAVASQAVLWRVVGLPFRRMRKQLRKLWVFALVLGLSFAFTANDPERDRWVRWVVVGWDTGLEVNTFGLGQGAAMILRIVAVVFASQIARVGDPRAIAAGFQGLGAPLSFALSVDAVLALFDGGGRGTGQGRGRKWAKDPDDPDGSRAKRFAEAIGRLRRGDVDALVAPLGAAIERAEAHLEATADADLGAEERARRADVAVVAGLSLAMLGIRALRVLPAVPFAPGHKLVLLTPFYILATLHTRGRAGATLTGGTMGVVGFLMGDGKYGVFEALKHTAPGVVCDAVLPWVCRDGRRPGPVFWTLFGGGLAVARFVTIFAIVFIVQAPAIAYAIFLPGLAVHTAFGLASGFVTFHIVRSVDTMRARQTRMRRELGAQGSLSRGFEHPKPGAESAELLDRTNASLGGVAGVFPPSRETGAD